MHSHHQRCHSRVLANAYALDEMQQKFGEDSIWVYEIIRYNHMSVMIGEATEYSTEGSISQKVCDTTFSSPPQRIELLSSERKADIDQEHDGIKKPSTPHNQVF